MFWPRHGTKDKDGWAIDHNLVPTMVKNATAELARLLISEDRTAEPDTLGFTRIKAGSLELVVDKADRKNVLPASVTRMLAPVATIAGSGVLRLVRT